MNTKLIDIRSLSYKEWVKLIFDHPEEDDTWYEQEHYTFKDLDSVRLVNYISTMCKGFSEIARTYSLAQIDQGIKFLFSYECYGFYLFDTNIPIEDRKECICCMYYVFSDVVAKSEVEVLENCFFMWWDIIAEDLWVTADGRELNKEEREMQQTIFETLIKILTLNDIRCQQYAIHGLGHLKHPKSKVVIQNYIDTHITELTEEGSEWLKQCRDGTVL